MRVERVSERSKGSEDVRVPDELPCPFVIRRRRRWFGCVGASDGRARFCKLILRLDPCCESAREVERLGVVERTVGEDFAEVIAGMGGRASEGKVATFEAIEENLADLLDVLVFTADAIDGRDDDGEEGACSSRWSAGESRFGGNWHSQPFIRTAPKHPLASTRTPTSKVGGGVPGGRTSTSILPGSPSTGLKSRKKPVSSIVIRFSGPVT